MAEPDWSALRRLFPILDQAHYLAACSHAPLATPVEDAMQRFLESWRARGNPWENEWLPTVSRAVDRFARLIGAAPETIGLTGSVSTALGSILSSLGPVFARRPNVVVSALDFPTLPDILLAHQRSGDISLTILPAEDGRVSLAAYERAIDDRTALVCISSASYASGALFPVQEVCQLARARGALSLVDAYQTLGALRIDVARLQPDFLVTGALKYLLGTAGLGFIYAAPHTVEHLEPRAIGWMGMADPFGTDFDRLEYAAGAARFQAGTFTISSCYAAEAAIGLLLETGPEASERRVLALSSAFARGLVEMNVKPLAPVASLGPMVAIPVSGDAHEWQERLRAEEGVITAARGNALRFAFHLYNDQSDVDACLEVVRRRLRTQQTVAGSV